MQRCADTQKQDTKVKNLLEKAISQILLKYCTIIQTHSIATKKGELVCVPVLPSKTNPIQFYQTCIVAYSQNLWKIPSACYVKPSSVYNIVETVHK